MTDTDLLPDEIDDALAWWRNCPNEPWNSKYAREIDKLVLVGLENTPSSNRANERGEVVPGAMRCAKCNFRLQRNNMYMQSGTIGPGDNNTEPCPNGCGPLWPVTWKEDALEGDKRLMELFEENQKLKEALQHTPQPSPQSEMVAVPREVVVQALSMLRECKSDYCHPYFTDRHGTGPKLIEAIEMLQPYTKGQ